jgi:hypothetical protein
VPKVQINVSVNDDGTVVLGKMADGFEVLGKKAKESQGFIDDFGKALLGGAGLGAGFSLAKASADAFFGAIGNVGEAIGSATKEVVAMVTHLTEVGSALTDMADRTGVSTTQLQQLKYAGSVVGVSLDDAGVAMSKMQKNIVEGSTAFQRLGLNLADIRKMDPATAFTQIGAAIAKLPTSMQQTTAAMEIFGKGGVSVLPLLKENFKDLAAEAEKLGIVLDESTVAAADNLGDQATKLASAWEAVKNQFAAALVESGVLESALLTLTSAAGNLATWAHDNKDAFSFLFKEAANDTKSWASEAQNTMPIVQALADLFPGLGQVVTLAAGAMRTGRDAIKEINAALKEQQLNARLSMSLFDELAQDPHLKAVLEQGKKTGSFVSQQDIEAAKKLAIEMAKVKAAAEDIAIAFRMGSEASGFVVTMQKQFKDLALNEQVATNYKLTGTAALREEVNQIILAGRGEKDHNAALRDVTEGLLKAHKITQEEADAVLRVVGHTLTWKDKLTLIGAAMQEFGQTIANIAGDGSSAMAKLGNSIADVGKAVEGLMTSKTLQGKIGAVATGIGAIGGQFLPTDTLAGGALAGAASGAAMGASVGALFGGVGAGPGAIIGGIAGGIMGIFSAAAKAKAEVEQLHQTIIQTFGSIDAAKDEAAKLGLSLDKAFDSNSPKELQAALKKLNDAEAAHKKVLDGLEEAMGGLNLRAQGFSEELERGSATARQLGFLGAEAWGQFAMQIKETGDLIGALSKMGPTLDAIQKGEDQLGVSAGGAVDQLLHIRDVITQNADVADSIAGITQELKGLADASMLTDGLLQTLDADLVEQNKALLERGVTQKDAFAIEQPALQKIWEAHVKNHMAIDAETQSLLDQAQAQGIVGAQFESVNQKILDVLLAINDALGGVKQGWDDVGRAAAGAGDKARGAAGAMPGGYGGGGDPYDDGGGSYRGGPGGMRGYDVGTPFVPFTGPAIVHRGEMIVPAAQNPFARGSAGGGSARLSGGGSPTVVHAHVILNGKEMGSALIDISGRAALSNEGDLTTNLAAGLKRHGHL